MDWTFMAANPFCRIKWSRARELKEKGLYDEAEQELNEALEVSPDDPFLKCSLADLYLRQERTMEARILAEEVLALKPRSVQALCVMGDYFMKSGTPREALKYFEGAMQIDPKPYLALRVAKSLREMGKYEDALGVVDSALASWGNRIALLKEKALILNRMKRTGEALRIYEKILQRSPSDRFARKEIIRLRSLSQPREKVLSELSRIVDISPEKDNPQLHGLLAQNLKDRGQIREAAAEYRIASTLEPTNPYFLKQQGFCHYRLKDYTEAYRFLSEVFRKDPSDYMVRETLLKICRITGRLGDLLSLLEEVSLCHPENKKLLGTIKKVKKEIGGSDEAPGGREGR